MICVSLGLPSLSECLRALEDIGFAEIRLDLMEIQVPDIRKLFCPGKNLIAACRPGRQCDSLRKEMLLECVRCGAAFIDIENDAGDAYRETLVREAKKLGTRVIISYHNFDTTPSASELDVLIGKSLEQGADFVKLACRVSTPSEAARLLGLLGRPQAEGRLIVSGMGEAGRAVRIFAPFLGAPFTYASWAPGAETAPGQLPVGVLSEILEEISGRLRKS